MTMYTSNDKTNTFFGNGVNREARKPKALDPEYVKLDDRSLEQMISFASEYAQLVRYYDKNNEENGDWSELFNSDVSVILANIICTDLDKLDKDHKNLIREYFGSQEEKSKLLTITYQFDDLYELAVHFNKWLKQLSRNTLLGDEFELNIESEFLNILEEKVLESIRKLYSYALGSTMTELKRPKAFLNSFEDFDPWWKLDEVEPEEIFVGKTLYEKLHSAFLKLRILYKGLHSALGYLIYHFRIYFEKSLVEKSNHTPHIGLFISFLKLFKHIQREYNDISSRYLHYYYKEILKQERRPSVPDKAHVQFEVMNGVDAFYLPEGTRLSAGLDEEGEEIFFDTLHPVQLSSAQLKSAKSVYVSSRDDLDSSQYDLVTDIYAAPVADSKDGYGMRRESELDPWPLFGEEQEYKPEGSSTMKKAELGLAVSSPSLFLAEGNREVRFKMSFVPESTRIYKRLLLDIQSRINSFRKSNDEPMLSLEETFYERVFNQVGKGRSFRVLLSSDKGWYEVEPETIAIRASGPGDWKQDTQAESIADTLDVLNALDVLTRIPARGPKIVGFDPNIHGDDKYQRGIPVAKIMIDNEKQPFGYTFLREVKISRMSIETKVDRLRQLRYFNEMGALGSGSVMPFGMDPTVGSTFLIETPELFKKDLQHITLKINWKGIPGTVEEFRSYYTGYPDDYHPSFYKIHLSGLTGGEFSPSLENEEMIYDLFGKPSGQSEEEDEKLPPYYPIDKTVIVLDEEKMDIMRLDPSPEHQGVENYDSETETGLLKVELVGPEYAFGHSSYQTTFAEAVTNNAQVNKEEDKPIPSPPYTPEIKSVEISYTSRSEWGVAQGEAGGIERLYHIHPFGIENILRRGRCFKSEMFPRYDSDGYLFLGLEGIKAPQSISLYFQLSNKHTKSFTQFQAPRIQWSYLVRNEWVDFTDQQVLMDTTDDFTISGIVSLQLPRTISNRNSILPSGQYWLRVRVDGDTELLSQCLGIYPNSALVERRSSFEKLQVLAPRQIDSVVDSWPQISGVVQHFESFGGRDAEDEETFFSRVSERLRHKGRAITHWDYERLVLEKFHEVHQVKCLSHSTNPAENSEKEEALRKDEEYAQIGINYMDGISLVVVPRKSKYQNEITPRFNFKYLERIKEYLRTVSSPFVQLSVINPVYEYIRVMAKVKFIDGMNNGYSVQRLHDDIRRFIAPWLIDGNELIQIGGELNENVLQDFIKGLDYVQFLTKFSILHIVEEDGTFKLQDTAEEENASIIHARPWGIFIPDEDHEFEIIDREEEENPTTRINTEEVIRFQDRLNILGMKRYIKIVNPKLQVKKKEEEKETEKKIYQVKIKK